MTKTECPVCNTGKKPGSPVCTYCGYPFEGSEEERGKFIGKSINFYKYIEKASTSIRWARIVLFVLVLIYGTIAAWLFTNRSLIPIGYVVFGLPPIVFLVSGILIKRYPIKMSWASLGTYLFVSVWDIITNPESLSKWLIWKVVVIVALSNVLSNMYSAKKIASKSDYFRDRIFGAKPKDIIDEIQ